jgi:hypothetical protein
VEVTTSDVEGGREHRCISCLQVDEGPNATCDCMTPGPPCGICGEPQYDPITPWKSNGHWAEDGHEWEPAAPSSVPEIKEGGEARREWIKRQPGYRPAHGTGGPLPVIRADARWGATEERIAEFWHSLFGDDYDGSEEWDEHNEALDVLLAAAHERNTRPAPRTNREGDQVSDEPLRFLEDVLAVLVNTSVAPEIGAWRVPFIVAHRQAAAYLHEREHGTAPEAAVRHARADERAKGAVQ